MNRPSFSASDLIGPGLVLLPAVAALTCLGLGARAAWMAAATGLVAAAGLVVYRVWVARPRRRLLRELEEVAEALWRAAGVEAPLKEDGATTDQALPGSLRRLQASLAGRLSRTSAELSNVRAILDAGPSPVLATDASGVVLICNQAAETFFGGGGRARPVVGRSVDQLFTRAEVLAQHDEALRGTAQVSRVRLTTPEGPRTFQVLSAPLRVQGDGQNHATGVVMTMRDVTELALAVDLKTDFVANASHELRTPLAAIKAAAETLSEGAWDEAEMRERLTRVIQGNVTRLEELVRDLLDLSRLESPEAPVSLSPVHLPETAQGLKETFEGVCRERGLALEFAIDPACERVTTDARLLALILRNLIDNATKYAYEGTTVRVTAEPMGPHEGLRLRVIDRGIGIPLDHQQRIFERFYQVDPARTGGLTTRGTGLGLAIVKHAVKALGGTIGVESVWKQGTTMTVEMPRALRRAREQEQTPA